MQPADSFLRDLKCSMTMNQPTDISPEPEQSALKDITVEYHAAGSDVVYPLQTPEDRGWVDFRDQCRRQMKRSIDDRLKYGFCRMYKPVLDDAPGRSFKTMAEYRAWCEANLPDYLGFKRPRR